MNDWRIVIVWVCGSTTLEYFPDGKGEGKRPSRRFHIPFAFPLITVERRK